MLHFSSFFSGNSLRFSENDLNILLMFQNLFPKSTISEGIQYETDILLLNVGTIWYIFKNFFSFCRRKNTVESYIMEQETRLLQDLESAVFNEFRKDVRKRLRRHSRSGRSGLPKITESDRANLHRKKAMSEKVRGSRTRSRVRREASSDVEEMESEMVEMGSNSSTPQKSRRYLTSDAPVIICEDNTGMQFLETVHRPFQIS